MGVSQTRTEGRPLLQQLAMASPAGSRNPRKLSAAQRQARDYRHKFADQYGLSHDWREWDSDTIERAQAAGMFSGQSAAEAIRTAPSPQNVQASVDNGRAMMDAITSERAGNRTTGVRPFRPKQTRTPNGVLAALRAIGL